MRSVSQICLYFSCLRSGHTTKLLHEVLLQHIALLYLVANGSFPYIDGWDDL